MADYPNIGYQEAVEALRVQYGFDFATVGLSSEPGAPLQWKHASGASSDRYRRIMLAPGHGVGGIVLKLGRPMMFTDIDQQLDPRDWSSYPIVFAEDLHSFCALPLSDGPHVMGVLLCGFRATGPGHEKLFMDFTETMRKGFCGMLVPSGDFMHFEELSSEAELEEALRAESVSLGQEQERQRISRELHDGLAQELLAVSIMVKRLGLIHEDEESAALVAEAQAHIKRMVEEIHSLSVQLRPLALDDLGLAAALRSQGELYQKGFGVMVYVRDKTGEMRFGESTETQVYRIAQEAMLNACKYSGADAIDVRLSTDEDTLVLEVADQGCGFDTQAPMRQGTGYGMSTMRERAGLAGGTLEIESGSGGTKVMLRVPLPEETPPEEGDA